jgi:hypothetical protein
LFFGVVVWAVVLENAMHSVSTGLRVLAFTLNLSSPFLSGQKGWKKPPACPHALSFYSLTSLNL